MFPRVSPRIVPIIVAVLFLAIVGYNTVVPGDDPYRCRALLERGRWIDPPDEEGSRTPFKHWQPDGCMLHNYSPTDIQQCMEGRDIVFIGDSTSRAVAHGLGRLLQREEATADQELVPKHSNANFTYHGVRIQNILNVWLNTSGDPQYASSVVHLSTFGREKKNPPPIKDQKSPALVYIAIGPWFTTTKRTPYHTPEARMAAFQDAVFNASDIVGDSGYDLFTDPMDPVDGVGNQIFFTPPSGPVYTGQIPKNIEDSHRRGGETKNVQNFLHKSSDELNFPLVWAMPELVYGQDKVWRDSLMSGIHVIDQVAEVRANIMLNLRCNAKLDRLKRYPYHRTCCTDYGNKPLVQLGAVAFGLAWLIACVVDELLDLMTKRNEPRSILLSMEAGCFILAPLMCYYADRTQLMAKGSKVWTFHDFVILCIPCIAIALVTIRKSLSPIRKDDLLMQQDQPFLSRDQMDEWKGWMQFIILIYHWVNSDSGSIHMLIRVLVAAYLFQTGYGHTQFFLKKKDFSFNRVASVLLRLNLLTCSLAFFMNTDYMFYYFSPLVTFWFLVVYATMAIGHKRYNGHTWLLLAKIFISALLVSGIVLATPVTEWVFTLLRTVFYIQWSLPEWQSRLSQDLFIVYIGMLLGLANLKFQSQGSVGFNLRIFSAIVGFMATTAYFYANWNDYRMWHSYTSFIPILGFIAMRNITTLTRNHHSKAMAWLGRCSLETYTLQFHLLLAADTQGVLLIGGLNSGGDVIGRWKSLIVIVPVFLWISSVAATGTGHLIQAILHASPAIEKLGRPPGVRFMAQISTQNLSSLINSSQFRVATLLITLWLLNLLSPGMTEAAVYNSSTLHDLQYDSYSAVPQWNPVI